MNRLIQTERIYGLLAGGDWVSLPQIMALGIACHTRRISDLRKQGFTIECERTQEGKQVRTRYRLLKGETQ